MQLHGPEFQQYICNYYVTESLSRPSCPVSPLCMPISSMNIFTLGLFCVLHFYAGPVAFATIFGTVFLIFVVYLRL